MFLFFQHGKLFAFFLLVSLAKIQRKVCQFLRKLWHFLKMDSEMQCDCLVIICLIVQLMISWIVSSETFTTATMQVSILLKNWIVCLQSIKFNKTKNQPISAKQGTVSAWHDTTVAFCFRIHCEKITVFSNFPLNFSETNQNNQSQGCLVMQEDELELQRSRVMKKKHIKKHQDMVKCLGWATMAAPQCKKTWRYLDLKSAAL